MSKLTNSNRFAMVMIGAILVLSGIILPANAETYTLITFNPYETEIKRLQLVDTDKYRQIAADLAEIENQLKSEGANQEEIALRKANYFANLQMWSDVFWKLYSIPHPSNELKTTLEQLNTHNFCD